MQGNFMKSHLLFESLHRCLYIGRCTICVLFLPPILLVQLSQLSASESKLMGKTNDQTEEAKPRARSRARTQPLLLDWKYWKPSLGHLEMLIRLANSHWSWVASVELRVQAYPIHWLHLFPSSEPFHGLCLNNPDSSLISRSVCLPAGRIFSTC